MAIRWDFTTDHMGQVTVEQTIKDKTETYTIDIYKGNCLAVFVYNYEDKGEKYYTLHNFFMDKEHAKRCLGIDKKYKETYGRNLLDDGFDRYVSFKLDGSRKDARDFAKLLLDAKWKRPVSIELYPDMETLKGGDQ